ncbi:DUF309 domain-containing protein [Bacillus sp. FJAT-29953]|nr:DUF309 domain-containing protein [Bacillus sp. FJAT-29953]
MYPKEYIEFLSHFHGDRDYFECHEILEDFWKGSDPGNKESIWVGFILLAVSAYHHRRENFNGAQRTLEKAITIISDQSSLLPDLGLDDRLFLQTIKEHLIRLQNREEYKSMNLPISDPELLQACMKLCDEKGFDWQRESDLSDLQIVHRHKLRDRSSVIAERNNAILKKGSGA